jgi:hypothetical protein
MSALQYDSAKYPLINHNDLLLIEVK